MSLDGLSGLSRGLSKAYVSSRGLGFGWPDYIFAAVFWVCSRFRSVAQG